MIILCTFVCFFTPYVSGTGFLGDGVLDCAELAEHMCIDWANDATSLMDADEIKEWMEKTDSARKVRAIGIQKKQGDACVRAGKTVAVGQDIRAKERICITGCPDDKNLQYCKTGCTKYFTALEVCTKRTNKVGEEMSVADYAKESASLAPLLILGLCIIIIGFMVLRNCRKAPEIQYAILEDEY